MRFFKEPSPLIKQKFLSGATSNKISLLIDSLAANQRPSLTFSLPAALLAHVLGLSGRTPEAEKILSELMNRAKRDYVPSHEIAAIFVGLKRKEDALHWLRRAFDERSGLMVYLRLEPALDPLRDDPRYGELIKNVRPGKAE